MKQELNRNQLFLVAGGVVVLVVAGVLAWLGLGGLGEKQAEAQALAERMGNPGLAALLSDPGGASRGMKDAAEIQKLEKSLWGQNPNMERWAKATGELAGEGMDWSKDPGKWKDQLIKVQSDLQKAAQKEKVGISPDFYLGLDGFRQKSPTSEEVPELALHLSVAERLVRLLMEARKVKEQYPTVCEFRALSGPGTTKEQGGGGPVPAPVAPVGKPGAGSGEAERKKFRMEIRASPEVFYEYVRLLANNDALLILTNLSLTNEKQAFPLRSEVARKFSEPNPSAGGDAPAEKKRKKNCWRFWRERKV